MKDDGNNNQKPLLKSLLTIAGVALVIAVIAGLSSPMILRSFVDPLTGQRANLRNLGYELMTFAGANDGNLPDKLDDLFIQEGLSRVTILKFRHPRSKRSEAWIYFPGYTQDDRGDTIIAASPSSFSNKDGTRMVGEGEFRMVLTLDGRTLFLEEPKYLELIEEQQADDWGGVRVAKQTDPWSFLTSAGWQQWEESRFTPEHGVEDVPQLLQLIKHGEKSERWNAADDLVEIRPVLPEVTPALLDALGDSEAGYLAANGLAVISLQDESIVPQLIKVVDAGSEKARYWATVALEEIGLENAKSAIPAMIDALSGEGDLPTSAAKAVAGAGPDAVAAVPQLIVMTDDGTTWDCKCAIIALGRIGPQASEAIPTLTAMFDAGHEYRFDLARAIFRIDPSQAQKLIPELIHQLENQRSPEGKNREFTNHDYSAIDLLGEMGPEAAAALPILKANLKGSARLEAAWALWRIDPGMKDTVTPIFTRVLTSSEPKEDRFHQQSKNSSGFDHSFTSRLEAFGALWQMHPDRRAEMNPLLVALLHEWETSKVLKSLSSETRTAIPALESFIKQGRDSEKVLLAREMLQKIKTTDPGNW